MEVNMKNCIKCEIEKPIFNFNKQSKAKDKLHYYCKSCDNQTIAKWRQNNRERNNLYNNKYKKDRKTHDETFRIGEILRSRLRNALMRQLVNKTTKTEDLLGISFEEFKKLYRIF